MMPAVEENQWFAVYTKSRFERRVVNELQELGMEAWGPVIRTLRQWSDRKKMVEVPLFNSYVFVHTKKSLVRNALRANGSVYVVSFSGQPTPIPDRQIEWLKQLLESSEKFEISYDEFAFGDCVLVEQGPLKGMEGKFVNYKGRNRVLLQIDAINQNLLIDINPGFVKKVPV